MSLKHLVQMESENQSFLNSHAQESRSSLYPMEDIHEDHYHVHIISVTYSKSLNFYMHDSPLILNFCYI